MADFPRSVRCLPPGCSLKTLLSKIPPVTLAYRLNCSEAWPFVASEVYKMAVLRCCVCLPPALIGDSFCCSFCKA